MELIMPYIIGSLFAAGIYLMLQRSLVQLVIGLAVLTNAVNLLIFTAAGLSKAKVPVIPDGETILSGEFADPVPQALILTAIVIGFGVLAFGLVLVFRAYRETGTVDIDEMKETDE